MKSNLETTINSAKSFLRNIKRTVGLTIVGLTAVAAINSCGGDDDEPTPNPTPTPKPDVIHEVNYNSNVENDVDVDNHNDADEIVEKLKYLNKKRKREIRQKNYLNKNIEYFLRM